MINNDDAFNFIQIIHDMAKMCNSMMIPRIIRDILSLGKGLPLAKEKNGLADADVRPVVIIGSIVRNLDELSANNIPLETRKSMMGSSQTIGIKQACEASSIAVDAAFFFMENKP